MDDETDDEIEAWAANLSPDGDPGVMSRRMREFLGDKGYEKAIAQNDAAAALYLQRQTLINNVLSIVVLYGVLFGFVGFVAAITLVARLIF